MHDFIWYNLDIATGEFGNEIMHSVIRGILSSFENVNFAKNLSSSSFQVFSVAG